MPQPVISTVLPSNDRPLLASDCSTSRYLRDSTESISLRLGSWAAGRRRNRYGMVSALLSFSSSSIIARPEVLFWLANVSLKWLRISSMGVDGCGGGVWLGMISADLVRIDEVLTPLRI